MSKILEIACFSPESALIAEGSGANRVELCENYTAGGLTPSEQSIKLARKQLNIPLHVIVRPQFKNFIYTTSEILQMKSTIQFCKNEGVDGVVFGALNTRGVIDQQVCQSLLKTAGSMPVTFHRAIDACANMNTAIEDLIALGIQRVLTSGGMKNAGMGLKKIDELQNTYGDKIIIMPGGGIRSTNLNTLLESRCSEFHSAAITDRFSELADPDEINRLNQILNESAY